jgi:hypothetical protein
MNGDVMMLKRLFQYQAHNKLLPALQVGAGGMYSCEAGCGPQHQPPG